MLEENLIMGKIPLCSPHHPESQANPSCMSVCESREPPQSSGRLQLLLLLLSLLPPAPQSSVRGCQGLPGSSSSPAQQEMQPGTARGVWMVRVVAEGWQMRCDSPDTSCPSAPMVRAGCSSRRRWTGCCPAMSPGTISNSCYSCHQKASRIFAILRPCRMAFFSPRNFLALCRSSRSL